MWDRDLINIYVLSPMYTIKPINFPASNLLVWVFNTSTSIIIYMYNICIYYIYILIVNTKTSTHSVFAKFYGFRVRWNIQNFTILHNLKDWPPFLIMQWPFPIGFFEISYTWFKSIMVSINVTIICWLTSLNYLLTYQPTYLPPLITINPV